MANTDLVNEGLLADYHDELMKTHLAGGVVFDISAYNLTNGQPTPYADLAAAIGTNGANIPEPLRKGGMSVKFVQSSDNKYVQYMCKSQSFSFNPEDWESLDDVKTDLENKINELDDAVFVKITTEDLNWVIGGLDVTTGAQATNPKRVNSTFSLQKYLAGAKITVDEGYSVAVLYYNEDASYAKEYLYWRGGAFIANTTERCFEISIKKNDEDVTPSSPSEFVSHISLIGYTRKGGLNERVDALEEQAEDVDSFMESLPNIYHVIKYETSKPDWTQGFLNPSTGAIDVSNTNRVASELFSTQGIIGKIYISSDRHTTLGECSNRCLFYKEDKSFIVTSEQQLWRNDFEWTIPSEAAYFRICMKQDAGGTMTPDTAPTVTIKTKLPYKSPRRNSLYGKKISILGDSISTYAGIGNYDTNGNANTADGTYTTLGNNCRYPSVPLQMLNVTDCYWYKLIQYFGMELGQNESISGSKISGSGGSTYSTIAFSLQSRIDHLDDNGTPDIILIYGGTNDIGQDTEIGTFNTENPKNYTSEQIAALPNDTFADAVRTMLIRLQKTYPEADIIFCMPNYAPMGYYDPNEADPYIEVIREACDYFGVKTIDMRTAGISLFSGTKYMADGLHPNPVGMDRLYKRIKYELECWYS